MFEIIGARVELNIHKNVFADYCVCSHIRIHDLFLESLEIPRAAQYKPFAMKECSSYDAMVAAPNVHCHQTQIAMAGDIDPLDAGTYPRGIFYLKTNDQRYYSVLTTR